MVEQQQQLLFHHHQPQMAAAAAAAAAAHRPRLGSSRLGGVRGSGGMGEIVEVQGGHIVRSTGRKDRHSKVCTAKGPRDRRVRLSAHTAIQFYDVQDRLGYDRPSKAVDWLIKNAKAAIDELAELPPWRPTATTAAAAANAQQPDSSLPTLPSLPDNAQDTPPQPDTHIQDPAGKRVVEQSSGGSSPPSAAYAYGSASSFLPPSLESDSIADTFKFFFPVPGGAGPSSSTPSIAFQTYPQDLLPRSSGSHVQDLRLSLQSFQDQTSFLHQPPPAATASVHPSEHVLFSSSPSASLAFDASAAGGWSEQASRIASWNAADPGGGGGGSSSGSAGVGGYLFGMLQAAPPPHHQQQLPQGVPLHQVLGQGPFLTQRGPLQSNIPHGPSRAWNDPTAAAGHNTAAALHQLGHSDPATIGFNPGGFSAFRIAGRIQGDEEQHVGGGGGGVATKPPSNSPGSHR